MDAAGNFLVTLAPTLQAEATRPNGASWYLSPQRHVIEFVFFNALIVPTLYACAPLAAARPKLPSGIAWPTLVPAVWTQAPGLVSSLVTVFSGSVWLTFIAIVVYKVLTDTLVFLGGSFAALASGA